MKKKLLIIQMNEINFDLVKQYSKELNLSNFQHMIDSFNNIETSSEKNYENLEPWIQWVSFYTGKSYDEHKVFFLNELKNDVDTIFKYFDEKLNAKQCLMLPMNLKNNLNNSQNIFIPDPWTETQIQCDKKLKEFYTIIKKIILNNKNVNLTINEIYYLFYYIFINSSFKFKLFVLKNLLNLFNKKYFKAILFDKLISDIFLKKIKSVDYDISSIFLNAGAHIQHHYLLSSRFVKNTNNPKWYLKEKYDPIQDYLLAYDKILGNFLKLKNYEILLMTGLSQSQINEPIFYYNLKNPNTFFSKINIYPRKIIKRMSRDYTLEFNDLNIMSQSINILKNLKIGDLNFFSIKSKENKIFLEIIYPKEVIDTDRIIINNIKINVKEELVFLAIKNSIHNQKGYCFTNLRSLPQAMNVKDFYSFLKNKKFLHAN